MDKVESAMIRFNPLNPRTIWHWVRGFNGLKRIIADQSREAKILSEKQEITLLLRREHRAAFGRNQTRGDTVTRRHGEMNGGAVK